MTFAVITLAGADGMPLARNLGVRLGPSQFLDEKTCARQATVTLFEVSDVAFIGLDATSHDFGAVPIGVASAPVTFTVTNRGRSVSGTPVVALSGEFFQPRPGCILPLNGPGGTCTTTVVFRPTAVGPRNGLLTVAASPGGTVTAALTGEGLPRPADAGTDRPAGGCAAGPLRAVTIDPVRRPPPLILAIAAGLTPACKSTCGPGPACETDAGRLDTAAELQPIALDRTQADLGAVRVGASSQPAAFTVLNPASGTTGTLQATLTGDFVLVGDGCGRALAPGERCILNVVFRPTMAGARNGLLTVNATPGGAVMAALSGLGVTDLDAGAD